ncbi:putative cardiolipin synthase YwiE [compost metagenome]
MRTGESQSSLPSPIRPIPVPVAPSVPQSPLQRVAADASTISAQARQSSGPPEGRSAAGTAANQAVWQTNNGTIPREHVYTSGSIEEIVVNDADPTDEAIERVIELLKDAKHELSFQTYIFDYDSEAATRLLDALARKQKDVPGFKVNILYDRDMNPFSTLKATLKRHGVDAQAAAYTPTVSRASNHAKVFILDGHTAMLGGDNIDNPAERDLMVALRGPVVETLLRDFDAAWSQSSSFLNASRTPPRHVKGEAPPSTQPEVPMTLLGKKGIALVGKYYNNDADQALLAVMGAAKRELRIASPNFNDVKVWEAIAAAAERGVKVHITLPKDYNNLASSIDRSANRDVLTFLAQLPKKAQGNVELRWTSEDGKTPHADHTKYLSVDGEWAYVGSQNMDNQSWSFSRELGLGIDDARETRRLDALFDATWNQSLKVEPSWIHRYLPQPKKSWLERMFTF